ncbi:hypothetical protein EUV02_02820 [Polymorphobacter arshaanensis]|uniref:Uncharacterized protein n=1 Tax=Glacieibacterium arshaanense TaxID=2511025 RepID=A0A4Y9EQS3_9SPHN|nr:hypothetical protein [Polymorphobacter arshaanensis]TFU05971.1 hypothetical protein EUV02_02820 [Polymorphobacter arshaanensis]
MVFDLGRALRKKEEFESARLVDFEFRRRARATRLLLQAMGRDDAEAAAIVASLGEDAIPAHLAALMQTPVKDVAAEFQKCLVIAHRQLVAEQGDPAPFRLA